MPAEIVERHLPETALLIGQTDMPKERLDRAGKLRAIINVETNFLQNVDYETCFQRGIHVLAPSSAFARPVAKWRLGWRSIFVAASAPPTAPFARQREMAVGWRRGVFSLYGSAIGLIGFGDLARAFAPLTIPFGCKVKAYDPWVSDHFMAGFGVSAASLDEVLSTSRVIFIFAGVTSQNQGFLGRSEFERIHTRLRRSAHEPGGRRRFSRVSAPDRKRALPRRQRCLSRRAGAGRRSRAQSRGPVAVSSSRGRPARLPVRDRRQTVADSELILRGLPPLSCRRAQRETVALSRSKPIEKT